MEAAAPQMKTCSKCGETKPLEMFSRQPTCRDGYRPDCKICVNERNRLHRQKPEVREHLRQYQLTRGIENKRRYRQTAKGRMAERAYRLQYPHTATGHAAIRNSHLERKRGITLEEYEALLSFQKGVCALCAKAETAIMHGTLSSLSVWWDTFSQERHLLCRSCLSSVMNSRRIAENKQFVIEQLAKLPHVAWLAASSQNQNHDARQLIELIANGRLSDITTIRLAARGFLIKHPSSAD